MCTLQHQTSSVPGAMEKLRGSVSTCLHDSSEEIKACSNTSLGSFEDVWHVIKWLFSFILKMLGLKWPLKPSWAPSNGPEPISQGFFLRLTEATRLPACPNRWSLCDYLESDIRQSS